MKKSACHMLCQPTIRDQDSLERDEQLQEVRADLSSVPWPYDEDLGYVNEEGDEEDRPSNPVNMIKASESMHQHVKQRSYRAF